MTADVALRACIDGAIVVALVWLLNHAVPGLPAAARAFLWWCATAKFVLALMWTSPIPVPVLPAADRTTAVTSSVLRAVDARNVLAASEESRRSRSAEIPWLHIIGTAWLIGFLVSLQRGFLRWNDVRRAVRLSSAAPANLQSSSADLARNVGLRRLPDVRISDELTSPLVTGLRRPVVLLPGTLSTISERQQSLILCHELVHIKRRDLWLGWIPALAERIFFFHPAAHIAAREYLFWREAAADAAVLDVLDAAPQEYGRLLLDLGITRRGTSLAAAGAPWSFATLKRRIVMLRDPSASSLAARIGAAALMTASVIAIAPFQLAARSTAEAPDNVPAIDLPRNDTTGLAAAPQKPADSREEKLNFVFFVSDDNTTMSGRVPEDIDRARRFKRAGERLLWFRNDAGEFIVRDQKLLGEILQLWDAVSQVGGEQGIIGSRQAEIGARQSEIGQRQSQVGAEQARIGAEQARIGQLQAELAARESARLLTDAQRQELERSRRALDAKMRALDQEMRKFDERMRDLDEPMAELSQRMNVLSAEMSKLSEKMEAAQRQAEREMRALLDRAMASGVVERVK